MNSITTTLAAALLALTPGCIFSVGAVVSDSQEDAPAKEPADTKTAMRIQYLELVTPDVDATCATLAKIHGVEFGDPVESFGNARMADLAGGGRLGVRAPMHSEEKPVTRTYLLVEDLDAAIAAAVAGGGQLAMGATPMPGGGKFALYFQGDNEFGLWQR